MKIAFAVLSYLVGDTQVEQGPIILADDLAQLVFDQAPGWESGTRIGETLAFRAADGALHA